MQKKRLTASFLERALLCLTLAFLFCSQTAAQADEIKKNEFGIWGGVSPDSSTVFPIGNTEDARYGTIGLRYARRFNNNDAVNLKYTIDAIPIALLNYPDVDVVPVDANNFRIERDRPTARAFGVVPLGLQVNFRPAKKLQPFVNSSGGFLYFDKRIPRFTGTRFVFTADLGGGLEIRLKNNRSLSVGYKYLHLSNGGRGTFNPGFDQNLFYIGYSFLK